MTMQTSSEPAASAIATTRWSVESAATVMVVWTISEETSLTDRALSCPSMISETPPEVGAALPLSSDRERVYDYSSEWFRSQAQASAEQRPRDPNGAKVYW